MAESSDEPPHPPVDQGDASEDQEFMSVRSYNRSLRHMWTDAASDLSEHPHALCAVSQGVADAGPTRADRKRQKIHSRYPSQHRRVNLSAAMSSMSWHVPGLELLNMGPVKAVELPAQIKILHDSWDVYYQSDDIIGPIWPQLQQDRVLHPYVYCDGKVRREGRIVVPSKMSRGVLEALHCYAHRGMEKLLQLFKRRFWTSKGHAALEQEVAHVCNHCGVCQEVKPRRYPQPDTLDYHPIPEYPFSSLAMEFLSLESNPITIDNHTYNYIFIVVCRLTGYILGIPCNTHITATYDFKPHFVT